MHTQEKKKEKEEKKKGKLKLPKKKKQGGVLWLNSILWNLYLVVNLY